MAQPLMGDPELGADAAADANGSATLGAEAFGAFRRQFDRTLSNRSGGSDVRGSSEGLISMEWQDLSFSIGDKTILKSLNGFVEPHHLTCVLGPSGSGKSTLMNVLAGRQRTDAGGAQMRGEVFIAGRRVDPAEFRGSVAYVMQDDTLMATEKPRECLDFSAYLRLPASFSSKDRQDHVSALLKSLHLEKCADTIVGSQLVKGISGGERKRTSVGVELITNPSLLFLDEPLSGLDSYAAYTLVQALKDLTKSGVPVLCTVHQPSSEIFTLFDDVLVLHEGEVTYHGPTGELADHFASLGYPCPPNFNPADHVMFMLQNLEKEDPSQIQIIKECWIQSEQNKKLKNRISALQSNCPSTTSNGQGFGNGIRRVGFGKQLVVLTAREIRGTLRNKGVLGARYGMSVFLSGLFAWLFAGSAATGDSTSVSGNCRAGAEFDYTGCAADFQAHFGTIVSLAIASMMGAAQPILLTFPYERPVFLREYAANQYGVLPYFISKTIVEMPVVLGTNFITFLVSYWVMGLHGNLFIMTLLSWLLGLASSSLSLIVGCGVSSVQKAIQLAPLVLIPQMLFSGLFIPVQKIPESLRWARFLCPLKYAINLLELEEFAYVHRSLDKCVAQYGEKCRSIMSPVPGDALREALLKKQSIEWADQTFYLVVLLSLFVGFRVLATMLLWRKGRYVF